MKVSHGVLVVGCGPAGSMTGLTIRKNSDKDVLIIDRRKEIGTLSRCAGGVTKEHLERLGITPPTLTIASEIWKFRIIAPNKTVVEFKGKELLGWVLYRDKFDQYLADLAADAGALIRTNTKFKDEMRRRYTVFACGSNFELPGRYGFYVPKKEEMHACIQYTIESSNHDHTAIEMYFWPDMAPGGYLWRFPEGKDRVRVGLGIAGNMVKPKLLTKNLTKLITKLGLAGCKVVSKTGKWIPTVYSLLPTYRIINGQDYFVVGDCACHVEPITGGGVSNAMFAGRELGLCIANDRPASYDTNWRKVFGEKMEKQMKAKKLFLKMRDEDLNELADMMKEYAEKLVTPVGFKDIANLVYVSLGRHPFRALRLWRRLG